MAKLSSRENGVFKLSRLLFCFFNPRNTQATTAVAACTACIDRLDGVLITNAFLMRRILYRLYMCEAQSAVYETLQHTASFNNALHISLYPPPASTHAHTFTPPSHNLATPRFPSLPISLHLPSPHNDQSASEDVSSKIQIKSSTVSSDCERVRVAQSRQE